jgi:hypothetical protein
MTYSGSCFTDGDRFSSVMTLTRHSAGHATVFGADNLTLRLEGTCNDRIASYVGTADEVPGVKLNGLLIWSEEASSTPTANATPPPFRPELLPKLPACGR